MIQMQVGQASAQLLKFLQRVAYSQTKIDECKRAFVQENHQCLSCFSSILRQNFLKQDDSLEPEYNVYPKITIDNLSAICLQNKQNSFLPHSMKKRHQIYQIIRTYFDIPEGNEGIQISRLYDSLKPRYKKYIPIKECNHQVNFQKVIDNLTILLNTILAEFQSINRFQQKYKSRFEFLLKQKYAKNEKNKKNDQDLIGLMSFKIIRQFMLDTNTYNRITYSKICNFLSDMKNLLFDYRSEERRKAWKQNLGIRKISVKQLLNKSENPRGIQLGKSKEGIDSIMDATIKYEQILSEKRAQNRAGSNKNKISPAFQKANVDKAEKESYRVQLKKDREQKYLNKQKSLSPIQQFYTQQRSTFFEQYLDRIQQIKQRAYDKYLFMQESRFKLDSIKLKNLIHLNSPTPNFGLFFQCDEQTKLKYFGSIKTQIF